jgi:DNA-binding CsgD family transcriptional regulator
LTVAPERNGSPSPSPHAVITEEKLVVANPTAFLTDPEQLRSDAERLLESVTRRGRFDDASEGPSPVRNRAPLDRHYLAMCITIRLAAIMATENEHPTAWHELGQALANLQHSIQANDPMSRMMARGRETVRQPNEVDEVPEQQPRPIVDALSRREISIVERIGQGRSNKEIARQLGIAPETVKTHIKRIFSKLGVERRAQAACRAHALGLVSESAPPPYRTRLRPKPILLQANDRHLASNRVTNA